MRLSADCYDAVHERIRDGLAAAGLDALLLDDPLDVAYVTGFSDTVLVTEDGPRRLTAFPRDLTAVTIGA